MESKKNMTANDFIANCISMGITAMAGNMNKPPQETPQPQDNVTGNISPMPSYLCDKEFDISGIVKKKYKALVEEQVAEISEFDHELGERYRKVAMEPTWHGQCFNARSVQVMFEQTVSEWLHELQSNIRLQFSAMLNQAKRNCIGNRKSQQPTPCRKPAAVASKIAKHEDKDIQQPPAEKTEQTAQKPKLKRPEAFMPHIYVKFKECPRTTYYSSLKALYTSIMGEAHIDQHKPCPLHFQHDRSNIQAHDLTYRQRIDWLKKQVCKLVTEHMPNRTVEHIERITRYGIKYTA